MLQCDYTRGSYYSFAAFWPDLYLRKLSSAVAQNGEPRRELAARGAPAVLEGSVVTSWDAMTWTPSVLGRLISLERWAAPHAKKKTWSRFQCP